METGFLLILIGAGLVPEPAVRARRRVVLAAVAVGLALATLRAAPLTPEPLGPTAAELPPGFVGTDAALLVFAILAAMAAALEVLRARRSPVGSVAAGLLAAGAGVVGWGGRALIVGAPTGAVLVALPLLAAAAALLLAAGKFVRLPSLLEKSPPRRPVSWVAGVLAGTLAAAAGPHAGVVFTGAIIAGWSGYLLRRAGGGSKVPLAAALTFLLLPAWWLMATIAGPEGLGTATLAAVPLSPAAEQLLAPALLLAGWALAGLWPLHRQQPGPLTAIAGALLLARVAIPSVPDGIEHWRPLAMPLVVAGIWHAALSGALPSIFVGLAWVGLLAATPDGCIGAGLLLAAALAVELFGGVTFTPVRHAVVRAAVALLAGWGALLAVGAGLRGEVVYTVMAVGGIVAGAGRLAEAQAITANERSVTAPRA